MIFELFSSSFSPANAALTGTRLGASCRKVIADYFSGLTTCSVQSAHTSGALLLQKCAPAREGLIFEYLQLLESALWGIKMSRSNRIYVTGRLGNKCRSVESCKG